MRWPWSPPPSPPDREYGREDEPEPPVATRTRSTITEEPTPAATSLASVLDTFTQPSVLIASAAVTGCTLGLLRFYKTYLRRIPTAEHVKPDAFRRRSVFGTVTSVGDGDNFRLFHTPGGRLAGWGWLPWRRVPTTREALNGQTIHIRIAGIDAPELAHFGRPAQPYGREALDFLTDYVLRRRVRAYIYRRDQYERVVATVFVRRWPLAFGRRRRDVGLEMLRCGLATVYEAKVGAEFGRFESEYREAEALARKRAVGIWSQPGFWERLVGGGGGGRGLEESPREYKTRMKEKERAEGKSEVVKKQ